MSKTLILWESKGLKKYTERLPNKFLLRWFPGRRKKAVGSISVSKVGIPKRTWTVVYMVCLERREGPPTFFPHFLAGWGKVTSTPLLYLYMIRTPVAYSQGLLWGIMKFLPRNMTCQRQLSSQVSVWCLMLAHHNLPWFPGWHPNRTWLFLSSLAVIRHLVRIPALA